MSAHSHVYLSLLWFPLELAPKEDVLLALSCQAFARLLLADLRVGAMEQASGSIMTGIRAFAAHLPLTSLILLLWPSTAFWLFVYFQMNAGNWGRAGM